MSRTLLLLMAAGILSSPLRGQDSSFILTAHRLNPYFPTFIGNGNFSLASSQLGTKGAESYMAWVYDHGEGDVPRIAAIPAWNEIDFFNGTHWLNETVPDSVSIRSFRQTLNLYDGLLTTKYEWLDGEKSASINLETFISRANRNLAGERCTITPNFSGPVRAAFRLRASDPPRRIQLDKVDSIHVELPNGWPNVWYPGQMKIQTRGRSQTDSSAEAWLVSETEGRGTIVAEAVEVTWSPAVRAASIDTSEDRNGAGIQLLFTASAGTPYTFTKYVGVSSSHDTSAPLEEALPIARKARLLGYEQVKSLHERALHNLWSTDIVVEGDPALQSLIHSMLFYILSSVGGGTDFSIPPMGLSSCGYYGHIFWDADTWMFPALLFMHPEMSRSMVMFRYRCLEAAKNNARKNNWRGAMYPWESDEIGAETTPRFAYQNALHENHVMGDVALAQWQFYLATGDRDWLKSYGYPVIKETAEFWASRVSRDSARNRYGIKNIVSVDEGLIGIDNDTYTNAIARKNLEIAVAASKLLGEAGNPEWEKIISGLTIPYDSVREYHPTFENAPPQALGSVVSLLTYPIELPMSERAKRNNFRNAVRRMKEEGAGVMMTITFAPIVAVELRDSAALDDLLRNAYRPYLRPPFNVSAETPSNNSTNFLTGAGGFLQQVIFGYTGLRISEEGLTPRFKPLLPGGVKKLTLRNFVVRGKRSDIVVEGETLNFLER